MINYILLQEKNALFVRTPQSPKELMDIPNFNHRTSSTLMDTLTVRNGRA